MIWFWLAIAALASAATAALVLPLLGSRRAVADAGISSDESRRLAVYRDRRAEIESERQAGRLTDDEAARAQEELIDEAALQLPACAQEPGSSRGITRPGAMLLSVVVALLVPISAVLVYALLGTPASVGMNAAELRGEVTERSLQAAIAEIEERVRAQPQDGEAWAMLGQARRMAGDVPGARAALEKAIALLPNDARITADYAEALVLGQGGNFDGEPLALLERALKLDPQDEKAVALMAAAQYRLGNHRRALGYMRQLVSKMDPASHEAQRLNEMIAGIEAKLGQGTAPTQAAAGGTAASSATTVSGSITIDDALRAEVPEGATLFVVARGTDGSRVPLAALRLSAGDWPRSFELGDAQAMNPARLISKAQAVIIEARISRSGNAIRQSGDLIGASRQVAPGARDVRVRIDQRVP